MRSNSPGALNNAVAKSLSTALKILKQTHDSKEDFYNDFPKAGEGIAECIRLLKGGPLLDDALIEKIKAILGFRRIGCILELSDKINDINEWFRESHEAALSFYKFWGLKKDLVENIVDKYRSILLEAMLELVFRKGSGLTEVDAIRSFRYNMGGRLPEEYFVNLIRGWISEDLAILWIQLNTKPLGLKLIPMAHDADRKIRFKSARRGRGKVISGEPDVVIKNERNNKEIYLEIQRVDRGKLKETNTHGERPVNIPGHRPETEKRALDENKSLILFLFNEGTETKTPEIAFPVNPGKAGKLEERKGGIFVWVKFVPITSPDVFSLLEHVLVAPLHS